MSRFALSTLVTCQCCDGLGKRSLTYTEDVTLYVVDRAEWLPTSRLHARLRGTVKLTALCNRLADLERLGLVESRICATNHRIKEWRRVR